MASPTLDDDLGLAQSVENLADMRRRTAEILDEWERSHPQQEAPSQLSELDLLRFEEIAQLAVADIRNVPANGATVDVIDIHNGGKNHLKNESSARVVPVHSELVRAGLLDYVKALPQNGPLFPGLKRRESKGGKSVAVPFRVHEQRRRHDLGGVVVGPPGAAYAQTALR